MHMLSSPQAPTSRVLRQFGASCAIALTVAAARRWSHAHGDLLSWILVVLAGAFAGIAIRRPTALRTTFVLVMKLLEPVGRVVSTVATWAIFFLVITPLALVFRMMGRDELSLQRPRGSTCWVDYPPPPSTRDYFNQF